ncbi:hypothetical protein A2U01_0097578, partial [Trifolium medium]|nr:hypothetical protein [Trifolium medium]
FLLLNNLTKKIISQFKHTQLHTPHRSFTNQAEVSKLLD